MSCPSHCRMPWLRSSSLQAYRRQSAGACEWATRTSFSKCMSRRGGEWPCWYGGGDVVEYFQQTTALFFAEGADSGTPRTLNASQPSQTSLVTLTFTQP